MDENDLIDGSYEIEDLPLTENDARQIAECAALFMEAQ